MSRTVIIGGHGKVGLLLAEELTRAGHQVTSVFRNPGQTTDVAATGADPVVVDIEKQSADDLAEAIRGVDAIVFTAGAGGGSPERTEAVDHQGALKTLEAARQLGVRRFVIVSYIGADDPTLVDPDDPSDVAYQQAKHAADQAVMDSDLEWTIVRPGWLTDTPAARTVTAAAKLDDGSTSRGTLAAVIARLVTDLPAPRQEVCVIDGDTPIEDALSSL